MGDSSHALVIGAGMVGLSTAWFLQEQGWTVTVVDKTGVAAGSSWGNAGWLSPALAFPINDPAIIRKGPALMLSASSPVFIPLRPDVRLLRFLAGFTRNSTPARFRAALRVLVAANQFAHPAFLDFLDAGVGTEHFWPAEPHLGAFTSPAGAAAVEHELAMMREVGGQVSYEKLDGAALRERFPYLSEKVVSGFAFEGQHYIDPPAFAEALSASVVERGGTILAPADVTSLREAGSGVLVETSAGTQAADVAVIASGAWLSELARPFGVRVPVQAGRGYSFTVSTTMMPSHPLYFPVERIAITPLPGGLRIGGTMEFRDPDAPLDPRRIDAMVKTARPVLKGVDWGHRTDEWVGARPCTTDGLPLIGRTKSQRIFVNGGHGMWGIKLGPMSGKLLAEQIARGTTTPLLRHFDPLR